MENLRRVILEHEAATGRRDTRARKFFNFLVRAGGDEEFVVDLTGIDDIIDLSSDDDEYQETSIPYQNVQNILESTTDWYNDEIMQITANMLNQRPGHKAIVLIPTEWSETRNGKLWVGYEETIERLVKKYKMKGRRLPLILIDNPNNSHWYLWLVTREKIYRMNSLKGVYGGKKRTKEVQRFAQAYFGDKSKIKTVYKKTPQQHDAHTCGPRTLELAEYITHRGKDTIEDRLKNLKKGDIQPKRFRMKQKKYFKKHIYAQWRDAAYDKYDFPENTTKFKDMKL